MADWSVITMQNLPPRSHREVFGLRRGAGSMADRRISCARMDFYARGNDVDTRNGEMHPSSALLTAEDAGEVSAYFGYLIQSF